MQNASPLAILFVPPLHRQLATRSVLYVIVVVFLRGSGCLICSGIDALPSFSGSSMISSSSRSVVVGVFRESGVVRSFKVVDPVLFVFESHVLYCRDLQFL